MKVPRVVDAIVYELRKLANETIGEGGLTDEGWEDVKDQCWKVEKTFEHTRYDKELKEFEQMIYEHMESCSLSLKEEALELAERLDKEVRS